jgi:hypothetical protein
MNKATLIDYFGEGENGEDGEASINSVLIIPAPGNDSTAPVTGNLTITHPIDNTTDPDTNDN